MKHEVIIEYDADHGLTIPVSLSMSVANNVVGELIRCKDCKHFDKDEFCDIWEVYRTNESYCDIAERKEE